MAKRVTIEFIFDRNVNSELNDTLFHMLRSGVADDDPNKRRTLQAQLEEMNAYLNDVTRVTGTEYRIIQRDTTQLFHEKTNLFTPELAHARNRDIKPDFLGENLAEGHYVVEPPVYGEQEYYDALKQFLYAILPEKDPEDLLTLKMAKGQEELLVMQDLFWQHVRKLPNEYREGRYEMAYEKYRSARFNAGETSVANFISHRPEPPEDERLAVVFVGRDQGAIQQVVLAAADRESSQRMEVFAVYPRQFRELMGELIRQIENKHPEMAEFRKEYPNLREVPVPDRPAFPEPDWLDELRQLRDTYRAQNEISHAIIMDVLKNAQRDDSTPQR